MLRLATRQNIPPFNSRNMPVKKIVAGFHHHPELSRKGKVGRWFIGYFFFSFLAAGASTLDMVPVSLQAGHFLGLHRVSTLLPHFSQVKTAMGCLQNGDNGAQGAP
jgi:hypothetical protein